ncbi:MFS transporter, partial [Leucobacter sp. M11]|uniref:MFS transporter n=1 Tax=Leucobacter sp. M11 TaxID=2993565 RepID=UPI002D7E5977
NPGQQAVLADVVGRRGRSGQVVASYQMMTDLGAVLGPVLAGMLVDAFGFPWGFGVTAGILLVAAAVWAVTPDSRRLATDEESSQG